MTLRFLAFSPSPSPSSTLGAAPPTVSSTVSTTSSPGVAPERSSRFSWPFAFPRWPLPLPLPVSGGPGTAGAEGRGRASVAICLGRCGLPRRDSPAA